MRLLVSGLLLVVILSAWAAGQTAGQPLFDFGPKTDVAKFKPQDASVKLVAGEAGGLEITTTPDANWPGVNLPAPKGVWDLSAYQGVEAIVTNTGKAPISAVLRVDNAGDYHVGPWNQDVVHGIPSGQTRTVRVNFGESFGQPGYSLDASKVINILVFAGKSADVQTLVVKDIRPFGKASNRAAAKRPETPITVKYPATIDFESDDLHNLFGGEITTDQAEVISGKRSLMADGRTQDKTWFEFCTTRLGLLPPGFNYTAQFKYRVLHSEPGAKFYGLFRSKSEGWGKSDRAWTDMTELTADPKAVREATITSGLDICGDYQLMFGIKGAIRVVIDDVRITQGKPFSEPDPESEKIAAIPATAQTVGSFDFENANESVSVPAAALTGDSALVISGKQSVMVDSLATDREWNTTVVLKKGMLEGGYRYYVYAKYRALAWPEASAFGYFFVKRVDSKIESDVITNKMWRGTIGRTSQAYRQFDVLQGEHAIIELGICKHGKMVVDDLVVRREPLPPRAIDSRVPLKCTDGNLVWRDEFDGTQVDASHWVVNQEPRGGGMWAKSQVTLDGQGHLALKFDRNKGGVFEMGGMHSDGKFAFRYGYAEARIKLPKQVGHWPGFWLMNGNVGTIGNEGRDGTEIDIVECPWRKRDVASHALHWDGYALEHQSVGRLVNIPGLNEGWHTFGVDWSEAGYIFFIDGKETWRTDAGGASRNPEYLLLTDEMGGWSGDANQASLPDETLVDYVRVWQDKGK